MKYIFSSIIIGVLALALASCGADTYVKKGDQHFAIGEYFDAAEQYKKAYTNTPAKDRKLRGLRAVKLAECYRRINASQKAIAAYNNIIRYNQADSLTHLRLAQQLMKTGNYRLAEKNFAIAIDSLPNSTIAKNGLASAKLAPQWKKYGSAYQVKRENMFNSRRSDYSPMLAGDDNDRLYFSSTRSQTKGDELSGITGTKTPTSSSHRRTKRENGQNPRLSTQNSTLPTTKVLAHSRPTDAPCISLSVAATRLIRDMRSSALPNEPMQSGERALRL